MTTETEPDTTSAVEESLMRELQQAAGNRRFSDEQCFDYILGMMLNENLSIPAQACAIHAETVDMIQAMSGKTVPVGKAGG